MAKSKRETAEATGMSTRDRIIAGAVELFFERGTFGASMRELAAAGGVTVQGLYYHFPSKRDLIDAVFDTFAEIPDANPTLPERLQDRIVTQGLAEFDVFRENVAFFGILAMEALRREPDAVAALIRSTEGWIQHWVDPVLTEASDVDPDADLKAAATVIATFVQGLNIMYVEMLDDSLRDRVRLLAKFLSPALTWEADSAATS